VALVNMLLWSLIGGSAGWLAGVDTPDRMGTRGGIIVGLLSAVLCGFVLSLLLPDAFAVTTFHAESLIIIFLCAFLLVLVIRRFLGVKTPS
jgi:uncharacterized membrane protein YeaQ/YmgE (transglycosylase-associated protein family)